LSEVVRETVKRSIEIGEYISYYAHEFTCGNCGSRDHAYVLKGRGLAGLGAECKRCGCYNRFQTFASNWSDK
jgi:transcription elongation factor Elf1